jgi:hypothetical protein
MDLMRRREESETKRNPTAAFNAVCELLGRADELR